MSVSTPPLLLVDDEPNMRRSIETILAAEGYKVVGVESAEHGLKQLEQHGFFMVITDARLSGMSGYEFLARAQNQWPRVPVLMITAYATPKLAVEAVKAGAIDYLAKPFAPEELLHAVGRCAERHRLLLENDALRARSGGPFGLDQIIGKSPEMAKLRGLVQQVAPTNATVLILGESGTGKELIAGALHTLSARSARNYIRINCAALPENLLESELFGHEKGSFTGALRQKTGRVEEANGGTMFLDEIGDMSRSLQAKLLRFLEDGSFTRVGGNQELRVDVRLIAATNRDILEALRQNQFREDLYHRLNVVQLRPPALRDRGDDIVLLAEHFLRHFCFTQNKAPKRLSRVAEQKLLAHHWPGNVRELRNVIERAVILESDEQVRAENLPDFHIETRMRKVEAKAAPADLSLDDALAAHERELIMATLERFGNSINKTAESLKMTRHALRYRMQRLNITTETGRDEEGEPAMEKGERHV
jgi:DNA-binding NtrC family response regulator